MLQFSKLKRGKMFILAENAENSKEIAFNLKPGLAQGLSISDPMLH
jgi:hypothetical protein